MQYLKTGEDNYDILLREKRVTELQFVFLVRKANVGMGKYKHRKMKMRTCYVIKSRWWT